jgi:hypothetical protein
MTGQVLSNRQALTPIFIGVNLDAVITDEGDLSDPSAIFILLMLKYRMSGTPVKFIPPAGTAPAPSPSALSSWSQRWFGSSIPTAPPIQSGKSGIMISSVAAKPAKESTPAGRGAKGVQGIVKKGLAMKAFDLLMKGAVADKAMRDTRAEIREEEGRPVPALGFDAQGGRNEAAREDFNAGRMNDAIDAKKILSMAYDGHERTVEPHATGQNHKGTNLLRAYQSEGGHVRQGHDWCLFDLKKIMGLRDTGKTFKDPRPMYRRGDKGMTSIWREV